MLPVVLPVTSRAEVDTGRQRWAQDPLRASCPCTMWEVLACCALVGNYLVRVWLCEGGFYLQLISLYVLY